MKIYTCSVATPNNLPAGHSFSEPNSLTSSGTPPTLINDLDSSGGKPNPFLKFPGSVKTIILGLILLFSVSFAHAATYYAVTTTSNPVAAGTVLTISAQLTDANGPVSTPSPLTVTWTQSDLLANTGSFPGTSPYTSITNANGLATISFTTSTLAGRTTQITVTDNSSTPFTGTSLPITTTFGLASQLIFTTEPGGATGGSNLTPQPVVTVEDQYGNVVTDATNSVTLAIGNNPSSGTLSASTNPLIPTSGVSSFTNVKIDKAGNGYTLTASATGLTPAISTPSFNITAGAATRLVITGSGTQTAGIAQNITITAEDALGNTDLTYTGDKSLTFSGAGSSVNPVTVPTVTDKTGAPINFGTSATITFTNGLAVVSSSHNGVMTLYKAESTLISVTDGSLSSSGADQLSVTVSAGVLGNFGWNVTSPQISLVAFTGTNTLTALDNYGNIITSFNASANFVTLSSTPADGNIIVPAGLGTNNVLNLSGSFVNGVANLNGMIFSGGAGNHNFTATSGSIPVVTVTGSAVTINHTGTTYYSRVATGNWNDNNSWSTSSIGSPTNPTGIYPIAGDAVVIQSGNIVAVTANASCASVVVNAAGAANGITISGSNSLSVSGSITMNGPTSTLNSTLAVGAGKLNAASISIAGGSSTGRNSIVSVSTGTINVSLGITFSGTSSGAQLFFTSAGTLNIGGDLGTGGTLNNYTASPGSTVNFNNAGTQTVGAYTYQNLTLSNLGVKTTTGVTVNGILTIAGSAMVTSVLNYGPSATLQYQTTDSHTTGVEWPSSFTGSGGVIVNLPSGTLTFGSAGAIGNGIALNLVNGSLIPGTNLSMSATSTINVRGGSLSGTPQGAGTYNVVYTGSSKTSGGELSGAGLNNVTINLNSGQNITLKSAPVIHGVLTLTQGILISTVSNVPTLTSTANTALSGGSSTSYIDGPIIWTLPAISSNITYTFPLGNGGVYLPFALVNPTTTGTATVQAQAFDTNSLGTFDATLTVISNTEWWSLITTGSFTDSQVSLTKPSLGGYKAVVASNSQNGVYTSLDGTVSSNTITSVQYIGANRFFTLGNMQSHYKITSSNYAPVAGASVTISAQLVDVNGNPLLVAGKVITWSETDVSANSGTFALPTSTTNASGIATVSFASSIKAPRSTYITLTDNSGLTGTSPKITTIPGTATKLGWGVQPSNTSAGSTVTPSITLQVQDTNGNLVTTYASTNIILSILTNPGTGTLAGTTTQTTSGGTATFGNISINNAGNGYTLSATATGLTRAPASSAFNITTGGPSSVTSTITASPSTITANGTSTSTITVQALDQYGSTITVPTTGLVVTINSDNGSIGATTDNGNGTYTAILTSGTTPLTANLSFTFNLNLAGAVQGTKTTTVVFAPRPIDHFGVYASGSGNNPIGAQSVGVSFNIRIVAQDVYNNTVTSYSGGVTGVDITSTGTTNPVTIPTTGTFTNGVYDPQPIVFTAPGNYTITATQHSNGPATGTSNSFNVSVSNNRYAVASGNWSSTATWSDVDGGAPGASVPAGTDMVYINGANTVTVDVSATCGSIIFSNGTSSAGQNRLTISGTNSLTVSGDITLPAATAAPGYNELDVNAGTLNVNDIAFTLTSGSSSNLHSVTLTTGTITVSGNVTSDSPSSSSANFILNSTGTLNVGGSFFYTANGSTHTVGGTLVASSGSLVNFNGAGDASGTQYIRGTTYSNLTISNSISKVFSTTSSSGLGGGTTSLTVNGTFKIRDIATINALSGAITYGTSPSGNGTLEYQSTGSRLSSTEEWPGTFTGSGGVIIDNSTGAVTLSGNKIFAAGVPLQILAGATLNTGGYSLTLGGNFINSGIFSSGASNITISGSASQQIAGFTSSALAFTKTSATATLTGAVNTGAITLNSAGILNTGGKNITSISLILSGSSNLTLTGVPHSVQFGDSHLATWTTGAILTINGWQGSYNGSAGTQGRIFAGTTSSGLTTAQLAQIQFYNGTTNYPAVILSTGEVVPIFTVTTGTIHSAPFCVGASANATGTVDFVSTNINSPSSYQVLMSDASGSFTSPTVISSPYPASGAYPTGTITFTIPAGTPPSTLYKLRVDCISPAVPGSAGSAFTINAVPVPVIAGSVTACTGTTGTYGVTATSGHTYVWAVTGGTFTRQGTASITVTWGAAGPGTVNVTETVTATGCNSAASPIAVTIYALPVPTITPVASVYVGTAVTYTTESGMNNYVWTFGGAPNTDYTVVSGGTGADNSVTVKYLTPNTTQTVTVNYTNTNGCSAVAPASTSTIVNILGAIYIRAIRVIKTYGDVLQSYTDTLVSSYEVIGALFPGDSITSVDIAYGSGGAATEGIGTYSKTIVPSNIQGLTKANYADIKYLPGDILVIQKNLNIRAINVFRTYGDPPLTDGPSATGFTNSALANSEIISSVTISYRAGNTLTSPAATYAGAVTVANPVGGSTFNPANYKIAYTPADIIVGKAPLTITASDVYKPFGSVLTSGIYQAGSNFSSSGLKNNETISIIDMGYGNGSSGTSMPGDYQNQVGAYNPTGPSPFNASNYSITNVYGTIHVLKITLTVAADNKTKCFDNSIYNGGYSVTYSGFVPGDDPSVLGGSIGFTGTAIAATVTGNNYTIQPGGYTSGKYTFNYVPGILTINPIPAATSGLPQTICPKGSVTLGAAAVIGNTYSWTSSPAGTTYNSANPAVSPLVTTTYTLTETVLATGCSNQNSVLVTVNPLPAAFTGVDQPICAGKSTVIGADGVPGNTYSWTSSDGSSLPNPTLPNPAVSPAYTTTYTLTETITATGCQNMNSVTVTVNPKAAAVAGQSIAICAGLGTTLGAANVTGSTYSWSSSDGLFTSVAPNPLVSPSVTTTYTVLETTAAGCPNTNSVTITVNPLPLAVAGSDAQICLNKSVTLGSTAVPGNTYTWTSVPSGFNDYSANPLVSPSVTTTYTLVERIAATGCSNQHSVTVTVKSAPVAFVGVDQKICYGTSTTIGGPGVVGNTYTWTSSDGLFTSSLPNPSVHPTANTAYTLVETNTVTGCPATNTVNITVNPAAAALAGADRPICVGSSTTLGGLPVYGSTYSWTSSDGLFTSTSANPMVSPTVTTTYTVKETTDLGCANSNSVKLTVNILPAAIAGTNQTICYGASITLGTAAVIGSTYSWTSSDGLFTSTAANPTVSPTVTTTYTLVETNIAGGCQNNNKVMITVIPKAVPTISTSGGTSLCQGTSSIFTTEGHKSAYAWVVTGGSLSSGGGVADSTATVTWNTVGSQSVSVTYSNGNGCLAGAVAIKNITVNAYPAAAGVITGTTVVCTPANSLTYSVPDITNAKTYVWTVPGGLILSGQGTKSIKVNFDSGTHSDTISVYAVNDCSSGKASKFPFVVTPKPGAAGAITGPGTFAQGSTGESFSVAPIDNATSYTWALPTGGSIVSGAGTNNVTIAFSANANPGSITVLGSNVCGQGAVSAPLDLTIPGKNFKVFPDPSNGIFTAQITFPQEETFTIIIYDHLGDKVMEVMDARTVGGFYSKVINLDYLANGFYLVVFTNSTFREVRKMLISR